jgi:hypothetical protein
MIYPAYATYWIVRYAKEQPTLSRKIATFIVFIPVLTITTALWGSLACAILILCWHTFINLFGK